jgi:raffinose/stachyose/melibiose transport system substrate-binding protein
MYLTGSWLTGELIAGPMGENIGFFLLSPMEEDGFKLSVGGTSLAFAIRNDSPNADLAAEYIDYLYSEETAISILEHGFVPVYPVDPALASEGLLADVVAAWGYLNDNNAIGYYMDWVTPTMYDTITSELQKLMAGRTSPEEFVDAVNADYVSFLEEKGLN